MLPLKYVAVSTKSTIHLIHTLAAQETQSPPALPTATRSEFAGSLRPQIGVFPTLGVFPCWLAILRRSYPASSHLTTGPPKHFHTRKMCQEGSSTLMGLFRIWVPTSGWTQETSKLQWLRNIFLIRQSGHHQTDKLTKCKQTKFNRKHNALRIQRQQCEFVGMKKSLNSYQMYHESWRHTHPTFAPACSWHPRDHGKVHQALEGNGNTMR